MLPVLWGISNLGAFYISAAASFLGFSTFCFQLSHLPLWKARAAITVGGLLLASERLRIVGLTSIYAPLGLRRRSVASMVSRRQASSWFSVLSAGGRKEGFRLWTGQVFDLTSHRAIRLDVVTEGGQLIGRSSLPVSR